MSTTTTVLGTGGKIGGSILGGAIGSVLGPVGTWVGRYLGGVAGRAAGEALGSYMDSLNEAAETQTQDQEAAKPCVDCGEIDCFNPPEGSTPEEVEEFKRQLKEQQDAINNISPDQLVKNMENYENIGRGAKDATDRANARNRWLDNRKADLLEADTALTESAAEAMARNEMKTMDVIHTPDLSAGGTGAFSRENGGLASRSANRSIGSQWSKSGGNPDGKTRLEQLKEHAEKAKEKGEKSNAQLKLCDEGGGPKPGDATSGGSSSANPGQGKSSAPMS